MAVGLITDKSETAYREEVTNLAVWCQNKNLSLNVSKTKELIVYYSKQRAIHIDGAVVEWVEIFKFLGVYINKLSWSKHKESCEKGTTMPFPPQETEKFWHGSPEPQKVPQLHHPDWLHHHLVWQLLCIQP